MEESFGDKNSIGTLSTKGGPCPREEDVGSKGTDTRPMEEGACSMEEMEDIGEP